MIIIAGCTDDYDAMTGASPINRLPELEAVEIREYQGENLGSVSDFRENSIKGPQYVNQSDYRLRITGLIYEEKSYTYEEVLSFQSFTKIVTLHCVEGWDVKILWECILLKDILDQVKPEANTVIFHAYDGYTSSLPLDFIRRNNIMIAYKMNNLTLPPERGYPFQLVAEDKWGFKWVKWITEIELSDDEDYEGYWETRGYNNDADLDGPIQKR